MPRVYAAQQTEKSVWMTKCMESNLWQVQKSGSSAQMLRTLGKQTIEQAQNLFILVEEKGQKGG